MKKVRKLAAIPAGSQVEEGFGETDFFDVYQIRKETDATPKEIFDEVMRLPTWVSALFKLRNAIVGMFGLKTGKAEAAFPTISQNEREIVSGLPDKHLNFRAAIMKDATAGTVSLTTVVHFNNLWGRVYFLPVKPFHKIIIKTLLRRRLNARF